MKIYIVLVYYICLLFKFIYFLHCLILIFILIQKVSSQTRKDQIEELCYIIKQLIEEKHITKKCTILLAGDFNVESQEVIEITRRNSIKVCNNFNILINIFKVSPNLIELNEETEYSFLTRKLNEVGIALDIFKVSIQNKLYKVI